MDISVIVCSHNPRPEYLRRTLAALHAQTLPVQQWELLLVDNASKESLSDHYDLSWHPNGRHVREEELGLTAARLRGFKEARGELLILVDDDNILDPDYLEQATGLGREWPMLGAWGGQIRAGFEVEPPEWTKKYWGMLAIRENPGDRWSNIPDFEDTTPWGAGMVLRRKVAAAYAEMIATDPKRRDLDRKGNDLCSCGDSDLAATSIELGLGTGCFNRLKMTHIIPASRLSESYLLKLTEGITYSGTLLQGWRGVHTPAHPTLARRFLEVVQLIRMSPSRRRFEFARRRGIAAAEKRLRELV